MERTIPKPLILAIAVAQGLLLLALYYALEFQVWPHGDSVSLYVITTLLIALPLMAMLALWPNNLRNLGKWLLVFGTGLALVAAYIGYQLKPEGLINSGALAAAFTISIGIACFKALMYIQQGASNEKISYSALFVLSWRNFLILGLACLFTGIFWGILMLWAELFAIIEMEFFRDVFTKPWFYYPALSIATGSAIIIFRNMTSVIDVIARLLQALIKYLLPVVIFVAMLFLSALLFSGLDLLWKTGSGSTMVLWLLAIVLFFVNSVYQDKSDVMPYSLTLHRFIYIGIALLPLYSLIATYGLYLRIEQYGWTLDRCWGVMICGLLTLFTLGYAWGIIKKRDAWISTLSTVNVSMGIVVMVLMLLINSPLIDFRKISVSSQMARIESGETALNDLDISYFRRNLARPGYLAMYDLKAKINDSHPEIALAIETIYTKPANGLHKTDLATLKRVITTSPSNMIIPPELLNSIHTDVNKNSYRNNQAAFFYLIEKNMNDDDSAEYIWIEDYGRWGSAALWHETPEGWKSITMHQTGDWKEAKLKQWLDSDELEVLPQPWKMLKIGTLTFRTYNN